MAQVLLSTRNSRLQSPANYLDDAVSESRAVANRWWQSDRRGQATCDWSFLVLGRGHFSGILRFGKSKSTKRSTENSKHIFGETMSLNKSLSKQMFQPSIACYIMLLFLSFHAESATSDLEVTSLKKVKDRNGEEYVEVVGSRIKRSAADSSQKVEIISSDQIQKSMRTNLFDLIRDSSTVENFGGNRPQIRINETSAAGVTGLNLRGLGESNTLILLDGKKLPQNPIKGTVNASLIPLSAIERIEIYKDSASAVYGSNAAGGVVNIVTKKDFEGYIVGVQREQAADGLAGVSIGSIFQGHQGEKYSFANSLTYRKAESLSEKDRTWTRNGVSTYSFPPNYKQPTGATSKWHDYSQDSNGSSCDQIDGAGRCLYNYSRFTDYYPESTQTSILHTGTYAFSEKAEVFLRILGSRTQDLYQMAPNVFDYTIPAAVADRLNLAPDVRAQGSDLKLNLRLSPLGNREYEATDEIYDIMLGFRGKLNSSWDWEISSSDGKSRTNVQFPKGFALKSELDSLVFSGRYNPLDISDSSMLQAATYKPWETQTSSLRTSEIRFTGPLGAIGNNQIMSSVGASYSHEIYDSTADAERLNLNPTNGESNVLGSKSSSGNGSRETVSAFAETRLPLREWLSLNSSVRHDSYNDFGSSTNPSLEVGVHPLKELAISASASNAFKAPSMRTMYESQQRVVTPSVVDYKKCQSLQTTTACAPSQFVAYIDSNEDLEEERAQSMNFSVEYFPIENIRLGGYVWDTQIRNVVSDKFDWDKLLRADADGTDLSSRGIKVIRASDTEISDISRMEVKLQNLASRHARGLDGRFDIHQGAGFHRFGFVGTYSEMFFFREESIRGQGVTDRVNDYGFPRWRANLDLQYQHKDTSFSIVNTRLPRFHKLLKKNEYVSDYSEWKIYLSQKFWDNTLLTLGVTNVFSAKPPLDDSQATSEQLSNRLYSAIGQTYFLGVEQKI